MRIAKIAIVLCLFLVAHAAASGRTSVYAVIEKVVFEPNEANAERVQVWGAFSFLMHDNMALGAPPRPESTSDPLRGYMYFSLPTGPADQIKAVRTEWSDLKALAGTGQGVSFGSWMYMGLASPSGPDGVLSVLTYDAAGRGYITRMPPAVYVLKTPDAIPSLWTTNTGLVKLPAEGSHAAIVKKLRDALASK
jgi:hypothetical protein